MNVLVFILCKWRRQLCLTYEFQENVDLGELMFSLCYLPTAGRLTITMIKARNLKAMDITGASGGFWRHSAERPRAKLHPNNPRVITTTFPLADPYVKVSLMCEGRRLKKRKTSTKRNTLNPVYNEAIVFDVPPENIDQISLLIAVMDYDRLVLQSFCFLHCFLLRYQFPWCLFWTSGLDTMKWSECAGWETKPRVWGGTTGVRCWHTHANR